MRPSRRFIPGNRGIVPPGKSAGTHGLARVLSKLGFLSRQEAARWIADGRVMVDGTVVLDSERRTDPGRERIAVDGAPVRAARKLYYVMNKPAGVVTTARDPQGRRTVYDVLRETLAPPLPRRSPADVGGEPPASPPGAPPGGPPGGGGWLFPVGRLDAMTLGLLVFTNDTAFGNLLTDERAGIPKTYEVKVRGTMAPEAVERLRRGVTLDTGERTRPADVRVLKSNEGTTWLEIVLREGMNRQVRRMCRAVGHEAVKLRRVRIGPIALEDLKAGDVRPLTPAEIEAVRRMADEADGRVQTKAGGNRRRYGRH